MAPKTKSPRKPSASKVDAFVGNLSACTLDLEEQRVLKELVAKLADSSELLWACKGMVDGREQAQNQEEKPLNRCVKYLVGTNKSDGLSQTIILKGLCMITKAEESEIKDIENWRTEIPNLITFALNGKKKTLLPWSESKPSEILEWIVKRNYQMGSVMRLWTPSELRTIDWFLEVGHYRYVLDEHKENYFSRVMHRRSVTIKKLPKAFRAYGDELADRVKMCKNHLEKAAYVEAVLPDGTYSKLVFSETLFMEEVNDRTEA